MLNGATCLHPAEREGLDLSQPLRVRQDGKRGRSRSACFQVAYAGIAVHSRVPSPRWRRKMGSAPGSLPFHSHRGPGAHVGCLLHDFRLGLADGEGPFSVGLSRAIGPGPVSSAAPRKVRVVSRGGSCAKTSSSVRPGRVCLVTPVQLSYREYEGLMAAAVRQQAFGRYQFQARVLFQGLLVQSGLHHREPIIPDHPVPGPQGP